VDITHQMFNPLNAELNPICHLLAVLGAHHILHVSRIRVKKIRFKTWTSLNVKPFDKSAPPCGEEQR